jgi:hypothetical protein
MVDFASISVSRSGRSTQLGGIERVSKLPLPTLPCCTKMQRLGIGAMTHRVRRWPSSELTHVAMTRSAPFPVSLTTLRYGDRWLTRISFVRAVSPRATRTSRTSDAVAIAGGARPFPPLAPITIAPAR